MLEEGPDVSQGRVRRTNWFKAHLLYIYRCVNVSVLIAPFLFLFSHKKQGNSKKMSKCFDTDTLTHRKSIEAICFFRKGNGSCMLYQHIHPVKYRGVFHSAS